ncbi:hypothetical protein HMPREF9413_4363 [Paenibacillus sp. HGF7]|nr:hypothetical protein HMPREF9413_4363 [Paenibacillus sp. HGF7]
MTFMTGTDRHRLRASEKMSPPKFTPEPVPDGQPQAAFSRVTRIPFVTGPKVRGPNFFHAVRSLE